MKIENEKNELRVEDILDHAAFIRGTILNSCILVERLIDHYLAKHFTKNIAKETELLECVFATKFITFESKRIIFDHIIKKHKPSLKEKELNGLHASLDAFNKQRNVVAHCVIDYSSSSKKHFLKTQEVTFLKYEKSKELIRYSRKSAQGVAYDLAQEGKKLKALFSK